MTGFWIALVIIFVLVIFGAGVYVGWSFGGAG